MTKPVLNIDKVKLMDFASPNGKFEAKLGRMGPAIGAEKLGAMLTIVEPGKRAFPFHAHHAVEEMFFIIEGEGEYRYGSQTYPIKAGDLLAAPTGGAERAHQIVNTGSATLKYLSVSTKGDLEVIEYPDSGKFTVSSLLAGDESVSTRVRYIGRPGHTFAYFDDEDD